MTLEEILQQYESGTLSTASVLVALEGRAKRPLSEGQRGLWALQKMEPGLYAYNVPVCFSCAHVDVSTLEAAFHDTLVRHPILTAAIREDEGIPYLSHGDAKSFCVERESFADINKDGLHAHLRSKAREPFDLARGPLLRLSVSFHGDGRAYILLVVHHIVIDGSSLCVLLETLFGAYHDRAARKARSVTPPAASYSEFVNWERETLDGSKGEADREFWKRELAGAVSLTGMPTENDLPAGAPHEGEVHRTRLSAAQVAALDAFVQTNDISHGIFFLAVLGTMLHRYTGQEDIVVGMASSSHPEERFDRTVGYFVNALPIRSTLGGSEDFSDYARRVQRTVFTALEHGHYPFSRMVRDLGPRDPNTRWPIFQVGYNYQNFTLEKHLRELRENVQSTLEFDVESDLHQSSEYDFALEVVPNEGFEFNWKYNPAAFSLATIARMAGHFGHLIDAILASSGKEALGRLNLLAPSEHRQLVQDWNQTDEDYPAAKTCIDLFIEHAKSTPDRPAVTFGQTTLTYGELEKKSAALADALRRRGVGTGDRVGVCVERSLDMVVAVVAILKCHAAYVPLDPESPPSRLSFMLRDSACKLVVVQQGTANRFSSVERDVSLYVVDSLENSRESRDMTPAAERTISTTDVAAYLIYTSGSTGQPKGVSVPHRALTNILAHTMRRLGVSADDRLLAIAAFSFDMAATELFVTLAAGAHVHIADAGTIRDPILLAQAIEQVRPTFMWATPSTWNRLFRTGWRNLEKVTLVSGGEALSDGLKDQMLASGAVAWNLYGPTETTQYSAAKCLRRDESVSIGLPVQNTCIYILDDRLHPVPVGVEGEVCISGHGVASGYPTNPELTAQRFVEDPFRPHLTMYKTGDRARRLPNGEIKLLGRRDEQIKFRGYRIEAGEIEAALESYPGITGSAVVVKGTGDDQRLAAYFTGRQNVDTKPLRAHLKKALPGYMIPTELVALPLLPLTPHGKVDKNALRETREPRSSSPRASVHAASIERRLRSIFQQTLGRNDFDRNEGFFDIGGDSFTAVVTVERINEAFGCGLRVTDLFTHPSINAMCEHLSTQLGGEASPNSLPVRSIRPAQEAPAPTPASAFLDSAVAVIGMSCQFPSANDHRAYWQNLQQGKDCVRFWSPEELRAMGVPEDLLRLPNYVPQRASIEGTAEFDPAFFGISPRDAEFMDPQGRLLLLHSWKALEDAGHRPEDAPNTSVFMSTSTNFYQMMLPSLVKNATGPRVLESAEHYVAWTFAQGGSIPTMISTKLGLEGPSMHVSTNCSSALSGLYLACQSLLTGDADRALVGAATIFSAASLGYVHQPGLNLSSDGRCRAFDDAANGMAGGEGVGVVLLKRAREALADGDNVYCLIRGIAVNNDGGDKAGFHAPSVKGQARVIRKVFEKTGVSPETLAYVEAHGTGTKIGDPIEIAALTEAFRDHTGKTRFCGIGSVKTNIGHLDTAAGMAGLIKMALSLRHGVIPKTIHHRTDNTGIDWNGSPFFVADESILLDAQSHEPHRVGLSSFGIGGSNAHALLEQARGFHSASSSDATDSGPYLIPLSARDAERLRVLAQRLLEYLPEYRRSGGGLEALAYTLQVGRRAMASRAVFLAHDCEDLAQKLAAYVAGETPEGTFAGRVKPEGNELASLFVDDDELTALKAAWLDRHEWRKVASLWIHGVELDWRAAYGGETPTRVSLPTYPFETKRYWLAGAPSTEEPQELEKAVRGDALALLGETAHGDIDGFVARHDAVTEEMDRHLRGVLFVQLSSLGLFEAPEPRAGIGERYGIAPGFSKWLEHCIDVLIDGGHLVRQGEHLTKAADTPNAEQTWHAWQEWARGHRSDPEMSPRVLLAERMIEAIPDIVTGKTPATQIMFPGSSLDLVETIYKKNSIFDYFHAVTASAMKKAVEGLRQRGTESRIRILEIGAGTGSSSEHVFQRLKPYEGDIAEYCYTDLGKAFLIAAEKRFGGRVPYITFKRFDAEKAPSAQGLATGCYDIVLANNVLHATTDIIETVAHARTLLSPGGVLVLNELAQNGLFAHLTFGLLEGWWRFTDGERLAGGPALSPTAWSKVLGRAGFERADFPAERAHSLGWQIIVARADHLARKALPVHDEHVVRASSPLKPAGGVEETVRSTVVEALLRALKLGREELQNDAPFADYGLDSLTGVHLVQELNRALGIELDTTILFDHPTVDRLSAFILAEHGNAMTAPVLESVPSTAPAPSIAPAPSLKPVAEERRGRREPIAIIGMSGRFPGADDADEFWQHLEAGRDLVTEADRWDLAALRSRCVHGGFMKDITSFDPLFFNISGLEAEYMDPQQRLFLEETWKALEDSGYAGEAIKRARCGVYAGCTNGDYFDLSSEADYPAQALWGNMGSLVPSRISYYLDLHGPALTVDTACSSSLVAVHLACQALWNDDIDLAIAGGVFVQCTPKGYVSGSRAGMLSPSGRCRSFDDGADGFVPAEGVGSLILKRLGKAEADGDHIHGVIRGIGINQDGTSNGITAPNAGAQEQLIREIYEEFAIDCEGIQMIEAHGTGTKLGDPVEFKALVRAFRHFTDERGFCSLGSSKANIGHAQTAAGVLGIIKILLAMKHAKLPPLLHHRTTNKNIALDGSPFFVHTDARDWAVRHGDKRRAAITSLGASGTNAHAVIEEAPARSHRARPPKARLIALSARTKAALRDQMTRVADHCRRYPHLDLADVSYTLLLGRAHFEHRWAAIVTDARQLIERLSDANSTANEVHAPDLQAWADRYLEGQAPRFEELFADEHYRRMPLPTYPFERTSYWLPQRKTAPAKAADSKRDPHTATLSGIEFFLRDHRVQGSPMLPGAMYLELAARRHEGTVSLEDVVFMRPLRVSTNPVDVRTEFRTAGGVTRFEIATRDSGIHCQGTIAADTNVDSVRLDIPAMLKAFRPVATGIDQFYEEYRALGLDYGPSFRGCTAVYTAKGAVIGQLRLPDAVNDTLRDFTVHPALVDSALQCVRLLTTAQGAPTPGKMLFAFKKVTLLRPCAPNMWTWIRYGAGEVIDIDITDDEGRVCVMMRGAVGRPIAAETKPSTPPAVTLLPAWDVAREGTAESWPEASRSVAILGGTRAAREALARMIPGAHIVRVRENDDAESIERALRSLPVLDHLVWLSPEAAADGPTADGILENQSRGVLEVFRILKALLRAGYAASSLGLTVLTHRAHGLHENERIDPTHASIAGLAGSMAKEYPNWQLRVADLDDYDAGSLRAVLHLGADPNGNMRLLRSGQWFAQRLTPVTTTPASKLSVRKGAVVVIPGGAGGLGIAISEHLIRRCDAQIVWLGRREKDANIEASIRGLAAFGKAPCYVRADAADAESLRRAHDEIARRFGPVNGLIHASLSLSSGSLAKLSEGQLAEVLRGKLDAAVRTMEEFKGPSLDFALFLSSINSYLKAMAQGSYAAACTFVDTFASFAGRHYGCAAKVINLGYCFNNVGAKGIALIEREELMAGLETLLAGDAHQVTLMKFSSALNTRGMLLAEEGAAADMPDRATQTAMSRLPHVKERMKEFAALTI